SAEATRTSLDLKPTNLTIKESGGACTASISKAPFSSATAYTWVPFNWTVAPAIGTPCWSFTTPLMEPWAKPGVADSRMKNNRPTRAVTPYYHLSLILGRIANAWATCPLKKGIGEVAALKRAYW